MCVCTCVYTRVYLCVYSVFYSVPTYVIKDCGAELPVLHSRPFLFSALHMVVCACQPQSPSFSLTPSHLVTISLFSTSVALFAL